MSGYAADSHLYLFMYGSRNSNTSRRSILLQNFHHLWLIPHIKMRGFYDQNQVPLLHTNFFSNFFLNLMEHDKVYIRLTSKIQRTALSGHVQISAGFLEVQQADAGNISLVCQWLKGRNCGRPGVRIFFQAFDKPFNLIFLPHVGIQPGCV